jgi:hypothetical protein
VYIGIDPGLGGAVAVLATDGALVAFHDTPVLTLRTSRGTRQEYDTCGMVAYWQGTNRRLSNSAPTCRHSSASYSR